MSAFKHRPVDSVMALILRHFAEFGGFGDNELRQMIEDMTHTVCNTLMSPKLKSTFRQYDLL